MTMLSQLLRMGPECLATAGVAALLLVSPQARAGKGNDNCVGYIDSLPAQLNKSGTWCMRANLGTSITSGGAIQINFNNVVVDCNGYRIDLRVRDNRSYGLFATGNNNVIRNCDFRGFFAGMLVSGENNTIEDNRLQDIGHVGVQVDRGTTIRRNVILNVGGDSTFEGHIAGIVGGSDITDNLIDGVRANPDVNLNGFVTGISSSGDGVITRNRIRGLKPAGTGYAHGIVVDGNSYVTFNHIVGPALATGTHRSIYCMGGENHARDNIANGFTKSSGSSIVCVSAGGGAAGGTNVDK